MSLRFSVRSLTCHKHFLWAQGSLARAATSYVFKCSQLSYPWAWCKKMPPRASSVPTMSEDCYSSLLFINGTRNLPLGNLHRMWGRRDSKMRGEAHQRRSNKVRRQHTLIDQIIQYDPPRKQLQQWANDFLGKQSLEGAREKISKQRVTRQDLRVTGRTGLGGGQLLKPVFSDKCANSKKKAVKRQQEESQAPDSLSVLGI